MHEFGHLRGDDKELGDSRPSPIASARVFFEWLLDYAGLFPPASLSVRDALAHYVAYRAQPYGWLMSRFVLGVSHLSDMGELSSHGFTREAPLEIALVSRDAMADIARVVASPLLRDGCGELSSVEVSVDPQRSLREQCREVQQLLTALHRLLPMAGRTTLFFELPYGDAWEALFTELLDVLDALHNEEPSGAHGGLIGIKLRCGGNVVPPPALLALALSRCGARSIPVKFTAGLHHPFRHQVPAVDGEDELLAHGYLNVLFAALVAHEFPRAVTEQELCALVSETRSQQPQFTDAGLEWQGYFLNTESIERLRKGRVLSFGTCSFVEPLEEAIKRGWL